MKKLLFLLLMISFPLTASDLPRVMQGNWYYLLRGDPDMGYLPLRNKNSKVKLLLTAFNDHLIYPDGESKKIKSVKIVRNDEIQSLIEIRLVDEDKLVMTVQFMKEANAWAVCYKIDDKLVDIYWFYISKVIRNE